MDGQDGKAPRKKGVRRPPDYLLEEVIRKNAGITTLVAKAVGVHPRTVKKWRAAYPRVAGWFADSREESLDLAESKVLQAIRAGRTAECLFFLKCMGKSRGWIERQEVETIVHPDVRADLEREQRRLKNPAYREAVRVFLAAQEEADRPEPKKAMAVVVPLPPRGQQS